MQALDRFSVEKDLAAYIKKEFDKKHNPTWHCIVGRNFGACRLHRFAKAPLVAPARHQQGLSVQGPMSLTKPSTSSTST